MDPKILLSSAEWALSSLFLESDPVPTNLELTANPIWYGLVRIFFFNLTSDPVQDAQDLDPIQWKNGNQTPDQSPKIAVSE